VRGQVNKVKRFWGTSFETVLEMKMVAMQEFYRVNCNYKWLCWGFNSRNVLILPFQEVSLARFFIFSISVLFHHFNVFIRNNFSVRCSDKKNEMCIFECHVSDELLWCWILEKWPLYSASIKWKMWKNPDHNYEWLT
jgi:hypothetical protein